MGAPKAQLGAQNAWIQAQVPHWLDGALAIHSLEAVRTYYADVRGMPMTNASCCVAQTTKPALLTGPRLKAGGPGMALKVNFYIPPCTPQEHTDTR